MQKIGALVLLLQFVTVTVLAQSGTPDKSYGMGGKVVIPQIKEREIRHIVSSAIQPDGKIVLIDSRLGLVRLNTDGTLDNGFSADGRAFGLTDIDIYVNDLALAPDGKIVATGMSNRKASDDTENGFSAFRFNADGTPDESFNKNGSVFISEKTFKNNHSRCVVVQPDGKIILAGRGLKSSLVYKILRLNIDGSLDTGFGEGGYTYVKVGDVDEAWKIKLQADGKIVLAGTSLINGTVDFGIVRLNNNGTLDKSFGNNGTASVDIKGHDAVVDLAFTADGKTVVAGYNWTGDLMQDLHDFILIRLNVNGTLDKSFGVDGKKTLSYSATNDKILSLSVQADGRMLIGGSVITNPAILADGGFSETKSQFGIIRLLEDGSIDQSFHASGRLLLDFRGSNLLLQKDGKIVVVGNDHEDRTSPAAAIRLMDE